MVLAYQLNNFLATFEIYFALRSVAIARLVKSWQKVPEIHRKILKTFSYFTEQGCKLYELELKEVKALLH